MMKDIVNEKYSGNTRYFQMVVTFRDFVYDAMREINARDQVWEKFSRLP